MLAARMSVKNDANGNENRIAFVYANNVHESTQSSDSWVVNSCPAFKDCCNFNPEYISSWCGHGFESHSQPFMLTCHE